MKTRKYLSLIAAAALLCGLSAPTTVHAEGTISPGKLLVGTDLTYPPYNYFDDNNQPAGFDVEFMTALAEVADLEVNFADTRFENLIIGVSSGQFDVIASTLYVKPERAKSIDYVPYMKSGISIAVLSDRDVSFQSLEALCGEVVGSIKGSAWLERLSEINTSECANQNVDIREFPTAPEVTQALLSGGITVQVEDSAVLADAADKVGGRIKITNDEQLFPVIIGLGVKKDNEQLAEVLRTAIEELENNGTYARLREKYGVSRPSEEEFQAAVGDQ